MSSTSDNSLANVEAYLDNYNFTGGFPDSSDLAPSILFAILYMILGPVVVFRIAHRPSRTWNLLRPALFVAVRIATFILRAVMSKNSYGMGELIAELVLVSVGFLFIISPTISLWENHVAAEIPKAQRPWWLRRLFRLAQLVLLAAIITAVVGSSMTGNSNSTSLVKTLRRVSYILSLAVVIVTLVGVVYTHFHFSCRTGPTLLLIAVSALCLVVAVFRVAQIYSTNPDAPVRSRAAFYILQVTMEFIAVSILLAINTNEVFPAEKKEDKPNTLSSGEHVPYKPEDGSYSHV